MPGSNARALEKAKTLAADSLILDLEDAVAPDAKDEARAQVCDAARAGGYGRREVFIRANGADSPWWIDDLAAISLSGADGVVVPKVEDVATVWAARDAISGAAEKMAVWCMVETPKGVLAAAAISDAADGLVMGTSDLAKELRAAHKPDREPMLTSLGLCLLAARAADVPILDGVYLDLDDVDGFAAACRQGADLGFDGKTLIHPKQLDGANAAFAPSAEEVDWSRRIIDAHAEAEAEGRGIVLVDGQLIENLHVAQAHRVVAMAEAIAELEAA
jgi:citrate lyase subunit beta/citryl-CoA lyase